jgi:hypothetical protein
MHRRRPDHALCCGLLAQVVDYKQQLALDAVRNETMAKHLDFLVGRTEQFTQVGRDAKSAQGLPHCCCT